MYGVGEIHEDQSLAHYCYYIKIQGNKGANTYPIEGQDIHDNMAEQLGELAEDLIPIHLANRNSKHIVQIDSNLDQVTKDHLLLFL